MLMLMAVFCRNVFFSLNPSFASFPSLLSHTVCMSQRAQMHTVPPSHEYAPAPAAATAPADTAPPPPSPYGISQWLLYRRQRPRRAMLYIPASSPKMLNKACLFTEQHTVDAICFDLEDAVHESAKNTARKAVQNIMEQKKDMHNQRTEWMVRINACGSGFEKDDLEAILGGHHGKPHGIVVPKVDTRQQLEWVKREIEKYENTQNIHIIALIESPKAMCNLKHIAEEKTKLAALIFGADDYAAQVGAHRTQEAEEVLFARNYMLMHAKAEGLQAIDMVKIDFKDQKGLHNECTRAYQLGYTGKQIIHPEQIEVTQKCFAPTPETIEWAKGVANAAHEHFQKGQGAFVFNGKMIDNPTIKQANGVLDFARQCGLLS